MKHTYIKKKKKNTLLESWSSVGKKIMYMKLAWKYDIHCGQKLYSYSTHNELINLCYSLMPQSSRRTASIALLAVHSRVCSGVEMILGYWRTIAGQDMPRGWSICKLRHPPVSLCSSYVPAIISTAAGKYEQLQ